MEKNRENLAVRINKYLSDAGVCSRREADRLLAEGRITINGQPAQMGMKIQPEDVVSVDGKKVSPEQQCIVIALNKPIGIECTTSHQVKDNVIDFLHLDKRVYPIGRLDKNSCGLLLLTNDSKIAEKVMRASNYHEKEYEVRVNRPIDERFIQRMAGGLTIDQFDRQKKKYQVQTRPCPVKKTGTNTFSIVLTQGFHRQIRRMCRVCGYEVVHLKRVRIMNVQLGELKNGSWRYLSDEEIRAIQNAK